MVNIGQWDVKAHKPELEFATSLDQIQNEFIFGCYSLTRIWWYLNNPPTLVEVSSYSVKTVFHFFRMNFQLSLGHREWRHTQGHAIEFSHKSMKIVMKFFHEKDVLQVRIQYFSWMFELSSLRWVKTYSKKIFSRNKFWIQHFLMHETWYI